MDIPLPPPYSFFKKNLAHYLVSKGVTRVMSIGCGQLCQARRQTQEDWGSIKVESAAADSIGRQKAEWLIIANSTAILSSSIKTAAGKAAASAEKGLVLFWDNIEDFMAHAYTQQAELIDSLAAEGLYYQEITSLNLRPR